MLESASGTETPGPVEYNEKAFGKGFKLLPNALFSSKKAAKASICTVRLHGKRASHRRHT